MLQLQFAKSKMENEEGMNHLHIRVKPEEATHVPEKPIAFFLVIDTSSSMNGPVEQVDYRKAYSFDVRESTSKLSYVKQAGERLIDMMKDGDMLGVVSFSEIARREFDLATLNKEERFKAKDRIRSLTANGMTNVSDGLETAYKQIPEKLKETHHVKLILLSDGEANYGITLDDEIASLVSSYRKNDVSVSTIGVGMDYNSYFMETIATASGGMFYHLENMNQLNDILTKELETLTTLNTKQAKVIISTPDDIELSKNLNGYAEDTNGEVFLGNVFNDADVIVELFTQEPIPVGKRSVTVRYEYFNAQGTKNAVEQEIPLHVVTEDEMENVEVNQDVVILVKRLLEAKTKKESLRYYESGDTRSLQNNMRTSIDAIGKMSAQYGIETSHLLSEMENLEKSMLTRTLKKSDSKNMYAASYSVMNSQATDKNKNK